MKNSCLRLFVVLFLCGWYGGGLKAQCPDYTLVLNTQKLVDAFPKEFPNCKELQYALTITGDVNSLDSLIQLVKGKSIFIQVNSELTDLNGLSNCKEIETLSIKNNPKLVDISVIGNVKKITSLTIETNKSLVTIAGFDSIQEMKTIIINNNEELKQINGFSNLTRIGSNLHIQNCLRLESVSAWHNLIEVGGDVVLNSLGLGQINFLPKLKKALSLQITNNNQITNLDHLKAFKEANTITISNNSRLQSMNSLNPLKIQELRIESDSSLLEINCFDSLIFLNDLYINQNIKLKNIRAFGFVIDSLGYLLIRNNASLTHLDSFDLSRSISLVNIINNSSLSSALFLTKLKEIENTIYISNNDVLKQIKFSGLVGNGAVSSVYIGFNNLLTEITIHLTNKYQIDIIRIENNPLLASIKIDTVLFAFIVTIMNNKSLYSIDFLNSIKMIPVSCTISDNNKLIDISPLKNLTTVGDLTISNNEKLTNLNALDSLQNARSILIENNKNLISLFTNNGIEKTIEETLIIKENLSLKEIQFDFILKGIKLLEIASNGNLENVDLTNLLITSNFNLDVNSNDNLKSLNLSNIKRIITCNITYNDNLVSLGKSDSLYEIVYLIVENNAKLMDLSAFEKITRITNFTVNKNQSLLDLKQLKSLKTIYGLANISYNDNLASLFEDLTQIYGTLTVSNNPRLKDITGLRNIPKLLNYAIINNTELSHCAINSVCKSFENNTNKFFYSNGTGCKYNNEVKEKCSQQIELIVPNPAHTTITFTNKTLVKKVNIAIYDLYGRRIDNFDTTNSTIDISAYSIGTYIFEVTSDQLNFKQKFIKY